MECHICGLAPCDLPDGIDADDVFERVDGEWYCHADATGTTFTIDIYPAAEQDGSE